MRRGCQSSTPVFEGCAAAASSMPLRLSILALCLFRGALADPGGCVGTLVGAPRSVHEAAGGKAAIGAFFSTTAAAFVDPASPGNVVIPARPDVLQVDRTGSLSVLIPGSALTGDSFVISSAGPRSGIFVADSASIKSLDFATRKLSVLVGNVSADASDTSSPDWAPAIGSQIRTPSCLHVDIVVGDVYFCDGYSSVRVVRAAGPSAGRLLTVAGDGSSTHSVDGALANETGLSGVMDVCLGLNGDLIIAENDWGQFPRILRLSSRSGRVHAVAGSADTTVRFVYDQPSESAYYHDGARALGTPLPFAVSVCVQPTSGAIIFSDGLRIVLITAEGTLRILAGRQHAAATMTIDGAPAVESTLAFPFVRPGHDGSILVTDASAVYRIDMATGLMHVIAGPAQRKQITPAYLGGGVRATSLALPSQSISDVEIDAATGDMFLPVLFANVILRVYAGNGSVGIIAGSGSPICTAANAMDAMAIGVPSPTGVALDGRGGLLSPRKHAALFFA